MRTIKSIRMCFILYPVLNSKHFINDRQNVIKPKALESIFNQVSDAKQNEKDVKNLISKKNSETKNVSEELHSISPPPSPSQPKGLRVISIKSSD